MNNEDFFNKTALGLVNVTAIGVEDNLKALSSLALEAKKQNYESLFFPELVVSGYGCMDLFSHTPFIDHINESMAAFIESLPLDLLVGVGVPLQGTFGKTLDCYVIIYNKKILTIACAHSFYNIKDPRALMLATPQPNEKVLLCGHEYEILNNFTHKEQDFVVYFNAGDSAALKEKAIMVLPQCRRYEVNNEEVYENELVALSKKQQALLVSVNLVGNDSGSEIYNGLCYMVSPQGILMRSSELSFVRSKLITIKDGINELFPLGDTIVRAAALGLFDYMLKTYAKGFTLSMSGGADSALCAVVATYSQAAALCDLGIDAYIKLLKDHGISFESLPDDVLLAVHDVIMPKLLTTVYQGSDSSTNITKEAACGVSTALGARHYDWSISPLVSMYTKLINDTHAGNPLNWEEHDLTLQNIQARVRSPGIWMMANYEGKLLITTCNGSEDAVGYCTMDGDTSGCVAPIGDLCKSMVLKVNELIAKDGLMVTPSVILKCEAMELVTKQAPTAELRPGGKQKDEDDLMPYMILDRIHNLMQEYASSSKMILENLVYDFPEYDRETLQGYIKKYYDKFCKAQWKRERGATTFHLEKNDLNAKSGWRFPVLNAGFSALVKF